MVCGKLVSWFRALVFGFGTDTRLGGIARFGISLFRTGFWVLGLVFWL